MTRDLSNRILVMGFIAMWMVVVIHYSFIAGGEAYLFVRNALTQWAVPWFFVVSGAFSARSLAKQNSRGFVIKKLWGLVVPYLIWRLAPMLGGVDNSILWYLRSLIAFMTALLIFNMILPREMTGRRYAVALGMLVAIFGLHRLGIRFLIGTPTSPFYFIGGYLLSDWLIERDAGRRWARHDWMIGAVVMMAIGLRIAWLKLELQGAVEMVLRNAAVVAMIVALWMIVSRFDWSGVEIPQWMKATFFVYCCHGPILTLIGRQGWNCPFTVYFFFAPLSFFACAAAVRRACPRVYHLLSGGR